MKTRFYGFFKHEENLRECLISLNFNISQSSADNKVGLMCHCRITHYHRLFVQVGDFYI